MEGLDLTAAIAAAFAAVKAAEKFFDIAWSKRKNGNGNGNGSHCAFDRAARDTLMRSDGDTGAPLVYGPRVAARMDRAETILAKIEDNTRRLAEAMEQRR